MTAVNPLGPSSSVSSLPQPARGIRPDELLRKLADRLDRQEDGLLDVDFWRACPAVVASEQELPQLRERIDLLFKNRIAHLEEQLKRPDPRTPIGGLLLAAALVRAALLIVPRGAQQPLLHYVVVNSLAIWLRLAIAAVIVFTFACFPWPKSFFALTGCADHFRLEEQKRNCEELRRAFDKGFEKRVAASS